MGQPLSISPRLPSPSGTFPPERFRTALPLCRLSGLEPLNIGPELNFVNVGERTNVTGSRRFRTLIKEDRLGEALEVARGQVEAGAQILDVNMDEGLLDSEGAMVQFLRLVASEPDISRIPVMVDSSRWEVLEAGLQCLQGKGVVNSISMKDGENLFRERAEKILRYGAAVIVMAFDEEGQADTRERKVEICRRAYGILTEEVGFPPEDIIFDPNVFAVATGNSGARRLWTSLYRGSGRHQEGPAPRANQRRDLESLVLLPGQSRAPRGHAHDLPLPCDPRGIGHGDRGTRARSRSTTRSPRGCGLRSRMCSSSGGPMRPSALPDWRRGIRVEHSEGKRTYLGERNGCRSASVTLW